MNKHDEVREGERVLVRGIDYDRWNFERWRGRTVRELLAPQQPGESYDDYRRRIGLRTWEEFLAETDEDFQPPPGWESRPKKRRREDEPIGDASGPDKPTIVLEPGNIKGVVDQAEDALIATDFGLFQRNGVIVEISTAPAITADGRLIEIKAIALRGDHALVEDLSRAAVWEKFDSRARANRPANPPPWIVPTLRQRGGLKFPVLAGVIQAPTMRADGSILDRPGYDAATGLFVDFNGVEFPEIPDEPTKEEAHQALDLLNDLISTFPFVSDAARSVALSALLTSVSRRSLSTAPLHGFSATAPGTGKGKLVKIASVIATGEDAPVMSQGKTEEELEKKLSAAFMKAQQIICLDNAERPIGGEFICLALTETRVEARILGKSEIPTVDVGAFMMATGNNLRFAGDMTRRALRCDIDAGVERPELRVFDRDPVATVKADRPRYVAAVLTILRAFHVAGRPSTVTPLGSFEEWSGLVRGALLWLGCADPVDTQEEIRSTDPIRAAIESVMAQWWSVVGDKPVTVSEVVKIASGQQYHGDFEHPEFREALLAVAGVGAIINPKRLGDWLAQSKKRIVGGSWFEPCGTRHKVAVWALRGNREGEDKAPELTNVDDGEPEF
jgi:hypothetical protein